jgi:hypothetical protein
MREGLFGGGINHLQSCGHRLRAHPGIAGQNQQQAEQVEFGHEQICEEKLILVLASITAGVILEGLRFMNVPFI